MNNDARRDAIEDYRGRVQAIILRARDYVPATPIPGADRLTGVDWAQHFLDRSEAGVALNTLAWSIVTGEIAVPADLRRDIRSHGDNSEDWPPAFGLDDSR